MKKIITIVTLTALLLMSVGCNTDGTVSVNNASSLTEAPSQSTSSDETVSQEGEEEMNTENFYNIDDARKQYPDKTDSELFVEAEGYIINGYYSVDADTLRMLTTVPCVGEGRIYYKDYTCSSSLTHHMSLNGRCCW